MENRNKKREFGILNLKISGVEETFRASSLPMSIKSVSPNNTEDPFVEALMDNIIIDSIYLNQSKELVILNDDGDIIHKRKVQDKVMGILANAKPASGEDCFLKGIEVSFDICYPIYFSPEFQRYHFSDIISSQSSMHKLTSLDLDTAFMDGVEKDTINLIKDMIIVYNNMSRVKKDAKIVGVPVTLKVYASKVNGVYKLFVCDSNKDIIDNLKSKDLDYTINIVNEEDIKKSDVKFYDEKEFFEIIVANTPQGLMKTMRVTTNALQLKSMISQRSNHKLKPWRIFCKYMKELFFWRYVGMYTESIPENEIQFLNRMDEYVYDLVNDKRTTQLTPKEVLLEGVDKDSVSYRIITQEINTYINRLYFKKHTKYSKSYMMLHFE